MSLKASGLKEMHFKQLLQTRPFSIDLMCSDVQKTYSFQSIFSVLYRHIHVQLFARRLFIRLRHTSETTSLIESFTAGSICSLLTFPQIVNCSQASSEKRFNRLLDTLYH